MTKYDDKQDSTKNKIKKLESELEKIKKQNEEHLNGWRRAKADYLNLKKETEKKSKELIEFANAGLIIQILPIYEHFKTAWDHIPKEDQKKDWVIGIGHIKKQLEDFLKNLGLEPIKTIGEKFDHNLHEAVGHEKAEGKEDDIIIKEVKGGFKLYDKVLEPAKVIVVKN
jgi:molecular chaperone GrpE